MTKAQKIYKSAMNEIRGNGNLNFAVGSELLSLYREGEITSEQIEKLYRNRTVRINRSYRVTKRGEFS